MSKIICDICGTSYPESGTQCPICGSVRPADLNAVLHTSETVEERPNGSYTHVRGGRFSKANVKKRNQGRSAENAELLKAVAAPEKRPEKKSDIWFVVIIVALLAAIVAVVIYIAVRFFVPALDINEPPAVDTTPSTTEQTQETTTGPLEILCEEIVLNKTTIEFDRVDAAIFLKATVTPADTTEDIYFVSSDDTVVIAGADGRITAVGAGEATVTVYCGSIEATCSVICNFGTEGTTAETTEETTPEETTEPTTGNNGFDPATMKLNWYTSMVDNEAVGDVTLKINEVWYAYTESEGKIPMNEIIFSSSDTSVVTIDEKGVVTAVGSGEAMIIADYRGNQVKCRIIVP